MSLVKCPECGKEVSDKAKVCIQCGYPIEEMAKSEERKRGICYVNGKPYDLSEFLDKAIKYSNKEISEKEADSVIEKLAKLVDINITTATGVFIGMNIDKEIPQKVIDQSGRYVDPNNIPLSPKCPTCGSERIKELGFFERGAWGIKTFKCNNCGYEW